ncbi:lambda exonuclease family protein [Phenylobacterium sp.]|uniref:lambda exonuclease family protein n=1 Tax=Phenylobacterium sp. TaxID=1871053 RepID=UPI002731C8E4|nr:lambda exonuclease family protein [Phenylobacterium sp.]MDP1598978.1 YqaJ viral recombinase family protein [Phenylobacterium sp.]MDP3590405.1 YqaJ viral recombinase family protein [Phenylobacterium sp.]
MAVEIFNCEQGTPEWHEARRGIATASNFSKILAKGEGKVRATYMRTLAGEIITGAVHEGFKSSSMERGNVMEAEARRFYALMTDEDPKQVGFVRNGKTGYSPDSLIGDVGLLEIKTQQPDLLIETLDRDTFPSSHVAQCQGGLWVAEREWIDLVVYWPKMPLFRKRLYRDDAYIASLARAVDIFNVELHETVERIRRYGQPAKVAA